MIGITAHNEGRNLGRLIERLRRIDLPNAELLRTVVVTSGCTDDTVDIARRAAQEDERLRLVVDPERRGKAVAINQLLREARDAEIVVMESADTLPDVGAIAAMLERFTDPAVGMVGAHPVPEDDETSFLGFTNHLLWRLHHSVASASPKQGELVAWRNVIHEVPEDVAMDEAYLEAAITKAGLRLSYAPEAIVRNRGAATLRAFVYQRRRNHTGHRLLAERHGYRPATRDHLRLLRLAVRELASRPQRAHWILGAALLELWCSVLGWWDHAIAHQDPRLWRMVEGTKELSADLGEPVPPVAAVVVTHRGRENVLACLASLYRCDYPDLSVVVVDNGVDGAADAVRGAFPRAHTISAANHGLAHAFNTGLTHALGSGAKYVLQLNDDVTVAGTYIQEAVRVAEGDPRAGAVGGPIYRHDDPERIWFAGGQIIWPLGKTLHRGREMLDGSRFARPMTAAYLCGAAVLYRARALQEVGGWDETYFLVFEDADWSVRAARRGWRQLYHPAPKAWHKISVSFGGEKSPLYLYFLFRNNIRFMLRHGRPWHWPSFVAFFIAESVLRYSLFALFAADRRTRLRAIALAVRDGVRGTYGRGALDDLVARSAVETSGGRTRDRRWPSRAARRAAQAPPPE